MRSRHFTAQAVVRPPHYSRDPCCQLATLVATKRQNRIAKHVSRPFADRLALTLINRGQVSAKDFTEREGGAVLLDGDARKAVVVAFQERKKEELTHPLLAESVLLGLVPLVQARLLARHVRGEAPTYVPFSVR